MKQILSMLLALLATASMAVPAFAENNQTDAHTAIERAAKEEGISFEKDEEQGVALGDLLTPGETYRFKVLITDEKGSTSDLAESHLKDRKFSFQLSKGKAAIKSIEVVEDDGEHFLEIETAAGWPADQQEVKGDVKYVNKASGKTVYSNSLSFKIGYKTISDEALNISDRDEEITVDPSAPVITTKQFDKLEEIVKGGKVTFTNGDWKFSVKISGQESVNMVNNEDPIKDISLKYEDSNFKFVSFPAGPQFNFSGTLTVNMYKEEDTWNGNYHVYRYYQGKLTKVESTYNTEDAELSFNTKTLGRFVITDKDIPNGTVIEEGFGGSDNPDNNNGSGSQGGSQNGGSSNNGSSEQKPNPGTGSVAATELAVAMAAIALTTGTVVLKRKMK